jgi:hypothetical protein
MSNVTNIKLDNLIIELLNNDTIINKEFEIGDLFGKTYFR